MIKHVKFRKLPDFVSESIYDKNDGTKMIEDPQEEPSINEIHVLNYR